MRTGLLIILLAVMPLLWLVHIRRGQVRVRYRTHQLDREAAALRRRLGSQQLRLGEMTTPRVVWLRAEAMALGLTDADTSGRYLASRQPQRDHYRR